MELCLSITSFQSLDQGSIIVTCRIHRSKVIRGVFVPRNLRGGGGLGGIGHRRSNPKKYLNNYFFIFLSFFSPFSFFLPTSFASSFHIIRVVTSTSSEDEGGGEEGTTRRVFVWGNVLQFSVAGFLLGKK
ncbi:hypothetical protein PUN28_001311 [Cardiocondyla obscurior]|uniref:Transmembrane protein n=1 Tax=Cardiocondyla obscurior TaxID=286306 RepID=A0AAW2H4D4_9HYME